MRLRQNVDDVAVLIHGAPKILLPTVDSDEDFVQIPGVTQAVSFGIRHQHLRSRSSEVWRTVAAAWRFGIFRIQLAQTHSGWLKLTTPTLNMAAQNRNRSAIAAAGHSYHPAEKHCYWARDNRLLGLVGSA